MNIGQPLVLDAQLHAPRRVGLDHVDKLPGNGARSELAGNRLQLRARQYAFENAAERAAHSDLDLGHAQQVDRSVAHPFQVDIVDADHLAAVDVDDLAVDEVLLQVEVVALVLERNQRPGERSSSVPAGVSITSWEGTMDRPSRVLSTSPATLPPPVRWRRQYL